MATQDPRTTAYDLVGVHPNAPADLIATSYWLLVGQLQKRRERGEYVDGALHELTRAYELVSDPKRRSDYDASVGHTLEPLTTRALPRFRRSLRSRLLHRDILIGPLDHYEVLGISPAAPPELLPAAYQIMLNQYLRVPPRNKKRLLLLRALDDAYATLSAPEKREKYDDLIRPKEIEQQKTIEPETEPPPEPAVPPRHSVQVFSRGLGRAIAAGVRLPYRGARAALGARRTRPGARAPAERRVKQPPAPEPPISREPAPRPRTPAIDVEEALLGRIAAYVKEIQSPHLSAESREGIDGPRNPHP